MDTDTREKMEAHRHVYETGTTAVLSSALFRGIWSAPEDAVSILLDAMERTDADLAVGEYTRVIGPHRIYKRLLPEYDLLSMQEYMTAHARSPRPTDFFFLCVWNKMYRAEIIKKHGITMAPRSFLNDYAFVLDYLARTKTVAIAHEPVYDYIFRSSSVLQTALLQMDQKVNWEKYVWILACFDRFGKKNLAPQIYERCKRSLNRELGDGGTPFVSVILPAMDGEAALRENLKDILNQTYLNFELILLDDGKQKDIQALVRPLMDRDKRIRCRMPLFYGSICPGKSVPARHRLCKEPRRLPGLRSECRNKGLAGTNKD